MKINKVFERFSYRVGRSIICVRIKLGSIDIEIRQ